MAPIRNPHEESNLSVNDSTKESSKEEEQKERPCWFGSAYTKLHIWSLIEYEMVFYIDADCLVNASPEPSFT